MALMHALLCLQGACDYDEGNVSREKRQVVIHVGT